MNAIRLKLGVNIDHVATLRQARGSTYPDPVKAARVAETAGAHGITAHLREDRRHLQDADIYGLRQSVQTVLNMEMANVPEIVAIALDVRPDEVCLVPEKRQELTTEGGLDAAGEFDALVPTVRVLKDAGVLVSLFVDPDPVQIKAAAALGAPCIELHTGAFAAASDDVARHIEVARLADSAGQAYALGLQVNAGHGLTLENVAGIFSVPHLDTLNIGHSLVAMAVFVGLQGAVKAMLQAMAGYTGGDATVGRA